VVYYIIIYGWYGITYSKGKGGSFHCPQCTAAQVYRHRRVRRFFHIFFIPLIPLTLAGEYVECGQCKGTYKLDVLEGATPHGAVPESQRGVRRVLAMMMLADGKVEETEVQAIMRYLGQTERRPVAREEVIAELDAARREPADVEAYCRTMMGYLNEQGRRDVLAAAQMIASADGHVDPSEQRMLERIGIALGQRPSEVAKNLATPPALAPSPMHAPPPPPHMQPPPMQAHQMPPPQARRAPFCPQCGGPGRWLQDHQTWGCDHCRQVIPA
jgi:uncharacterized tellurite resistance protein B-like protein